MSAFGDDSPTEVAKFDPVAEAKLLLRTTRSAALATLVPNSGQPFATLVNVASAPNGSPILLLSELAAHRRHLAADPRLSLLLTAPGRGDPLAHPRLTILGQAQRVDEAARTALRARFLARHPKSALYADFPDFSFFHVEMESGHLNGGFARAASLDADQMRTVVEGATQVIASESEAIAHINADHPEVPALLASAFGAPANLDRGASAGRWRAIGLDPEGIDLGNDTSIVRVSFPRLVSTPAELRQTLVDLAAAARSAQ
jgi:putative heme iron utilization protein